ncbi:hypothetical protein GGR56DRAFT_343327 [Xylariaceae sp. FL0804]|nr:hypothetical protein GGR56DRAFT_343327 [Xylariaceae sp. FL0804]
MTRLTHSPSPPSALWAIPISAVFSRITQTGDTSGLAAFSPPLSSGRRPPPPPLPESFIRLGHAACSPVQSGTTTLDSSLLASATTTAPPVRDFPAIRQEEQQLQQRRVDTCTYPQAAASRRHMPCRSSSKPLASFFSFLSPGRRLISFLHSSHPNPLPLASLASGPPHTTLLLYHTTLTRSCLPRGRGEIDASCRPAYMLVCVAAGPPLADGHILQGTAEPGWGRDASGRPPNRRP